jgi:hypothetical protein
VALLEQALRDFSSSPTMDYEETYEAVLRSEFELMRQRFEKQIAALKEELRDIGVKSLARERNLEKQVEDLKVQKEAFAARLTSLRL